MYIFNSKVVKFFWNFCRVKIKVLLLFGEKVKRLTLVLWESWFKSDILKISSTARFRNGYFDGSFS